MTRKEIQTLARTMREFSRRDGFEWDKFAERIANDLHIADTPRFVRSVMGKDHALDV